MGDRVGKNEKTKLVVKLQPAVCGVLKSHRTHVTMSLCPLTYPAYHVNMQGQGPPPREPVVSEMERTAMMAYYFKRQEELKVQGC